MSKINKIIDEVKTLTVVELNELVKAIETEFGVSAAAVAAAPAAGAAAAGGAAAPAAKASVNVNLKETGPNKIAVIKVVKDITGLGIGEAKALVDAAPKTIKENVPMKDAEEMKAKLVEAGAVCELV
ncbi:MAG: 50S ribosomal protein L7/L12 [Firmicutes bacterium]|nr:50S ribosomal protein L7/L12 [Bacillota bacterium]MCL2771569.1 50S ribosomal protein L7/L12 [Bacillota bacterium]